MMTMRTFLRVHPFLAGALGAAATAVIALPILAALLLGFWHVYNDHKALHEIVRFLNAQIVAQQKMAGK